MRSAHTYARTGACCGGASDADALVPEPICVHVRVNVSIRAHTRTALEGGDGRARAMVSTGVDSTPNLPHVSVASRPSGHQRAKKTRHCQRFVPPTTVVRLPSICSQLQ
jgi:hypothetical protein